MAGKEYGMGVTYCTKELEFGYCGNREREKSRR